MSTSQQFYFPAPPVYDEDKCNGCNFRLNDNQNVQKMRLRTNMAIGCGHKYCEDCVGQLLNKKTTFSCIACGKPVKNSTLEHTKSFDSKYCDSDKNWREQVTSVYNKTENQFSSVEQYNDYLELIEDIVFSIVNEQDDMDECKKRLSEERESNKLEIQERQAKLTADYFKVEEKLKLEITNKESGEKFNRRIEHEVKKLKKKIKKEEREVALGEKNKISVELLEAKKLGLYETVVKMLQDNDMMDVGDDFDVDLTVIDFGLNLANNTVRFRHPLDGLEDVKRILSMVGEEKALRIKAGGGVLKNSSFDRELCKRAFLTGFG